MEERGAAFVFFDQVSDVDERRASQAPIDAIEAAMRAGVRRKQLTSGEGGVYLHVSVFPPHYTVGLHSHDQDEVILVLEGSCVMADGGPTLRRWDTAMLPAGQRYGFSSGSDGLTFANIRTQPAGIELAPRESGPR